MSGDVHQPSSRGLYAQYKGSHKATFDLTAHMFALVWCLIWFCLIIWVWPWPLPCLGVTTRMTADIFRQRGFLWTITFHYYSGGPYPKYHLLICLYVCYSPGFFQEIQPGFQYCTLVITMCEPNQPLEQIKQDTPAGWVAKSGCWVVHAAFTTLKPETSTKRPPNRCPDVSGCVPFWRVNFAPFSTLSTFERFARGWRLAALAARLAKWKGRRRQSSTGCAQAPQKCRCLGLAFVQRDRGAHGGFELVTGTRRGEFRILWSDPSIRVATAAWCEVAQAEEGQFRIVPRKRENWLKDVEGVWVIFLGSVYLVQYSIVLVWTISPSSGSMSFFWTLLTVWLDLSQNTCRCFKSQGEGAADLLEALDSAQELEVVNFYECFQIPAVAWQKLRGAKWPKLKKAYFNSYLAETEMVEGVCVFFWAVQYLSLLEHFSKLYSLPRAFFASTHRGARNMSRRWLRHHWDSWFPPR